MSNNKKGSEILKLFWSLDTEPMALDVKALYEEAYEKHMGNDSRGAIESCQKALNFLEESSDEYGSSHELKYAGGKCHLLLASIYLDLGREYLRLAEEHYGRSQTEFHQWQWKHLESLAYFGLAVTRNIMGKDYYAAMQACRQAQDCLEHQSIPWGVDTRALLALIESEREAIWPNLSPEPLSGESGVMEEKRLQVFNISAGASFVGTGGMTDLNLLARRDYERYSQEPPAFGIIDVSELPKVSCADYILEIDENVGETDDDAEPGAWLFIREDNDPERLRGKTVALLVIKGNTLFASQKIFTGTETHYFLKAKSKDAPSFVVVHYKTDEMPRIKDYYGQLAHVQKKVAYDVRVSGEVVESIKIIGPIKDRRNIFIWRIPRISSIAAGAGPIVDENIISYGYLAESRRPDANHFIVSVEGDSMLEAGIHSGESVLIRQQEHVQNGDIAAVRISVRGVEKPLGMLKHYHFDEREGLQHWFLKSRNPRIKHSVVVPSHTDPIRIRELYADKIKNDRVEFYEDAELRIAGKFIRVVERAG